MEEIKNLRESSALLSNLGFATSDDIIKVLRIAVHKRLNRNHLARALKWDVKIFDDHIFRLQNPDRDLPF